MATKRDILKLIANRSKEGRKISYRSLVREFGLSVDAACGRLERLWAGRLIESPNPRLPSCRFRLEPGEKIRDLRFRITERGRARLRWYEEQEGGWLW